MDRYPNVSDHGLIGDLQTAALVATDGTIDFFCCPRFDSPSVFCSLLDAEKGGYFRISPVADSYVTRQLYFPNTAMLITRFMTPDGVGEVLDFMPVIEGAPTDRHRLVRHLRVARGTMQFVVEIEPRFDYGRASHTVDVTDAGAVFRTAGGMELTLHTTGPQTEGAAIERTQNGLRGTITMREGESGRGVVLESMGGQPALLQPAELQRLADDTAAYWKAWLNRSSYTGRWREMVTRSAMTLKLMTYQPTGAPVAAATLGLPEQAGGERNWDYRFTWIRDGSLTMHALANLGYLEEAARFGAWIRDRVTESSVADGASPLKIMYRVDGSSDLTEQMLDHFEGWRGSRPVRIGNGAADQLQLDIYGEAADAILAGDEAGLPIAYQGWLALTKIMDWVADNWDQPDEGVWETRGGRKNFTYGRFQCWVALDRAIRLAERHGRPANVAKWTAARDSLYQQVMQRGWNDKVKAFTQHYDTSVLDSSLLLMPIEDFIAPNDPMWLSTLDAMNKELVSDSLVYRYNPAASPDGLHGEEGTFSLCTFLYVDALARAGRLDDAVLTFEKMFTYGNHLGLYSEEIGSTGEQLGNFPQAFTHLSLINSAITLNRELDRRAVLQQPSVAMAQQASVLSGRRLGAMYGQAAGLAALAALYPPALLIAAAYLSSASPRRLAGLFLAGAALMAAAAGIVVLVAIRAGGLSLPANRPPRYGLRVGLGALSLLAAGYLTWRYRRQRPAGTAKRGKPGRISRMTAHPRPLTALAVGVVLFAPGVGFIAAVQVIATAKASVAATVGALVMVVVIDLAFAWLPVTLYLLAPDATRRALKAINAWLSAHGRMLLAGSLGAIGVILLIQGAIGLA